MHTVFIEKLLSADFRNLAGALFLQTFCCLYPAASLAACLETDTACLKEAQRNHVVNQAAFWKGELQKPFDLRVGPAPAELVDYVRLDNLLNGFPERPSVARISPEFKADLVAAIAELPATIRRSLEGRLAGIYLLDGLGSTGFTDRFLDSTGKPIAAYVILDADVLSRRKANEWATWKERTPFKAGGNAVLTATIERPEDDNRKNAIQYILLHEFGHVLSVGQTVHPPWWEDFKEDTLARYPFSALSWSVSKEPGKFVAHGDDRFPLRTQVVYYLGAKLEASQAQQVYTQLEDTSFPTLYAATSPFDDFAESFVTYVHSVLMKKPFEITIEREGKMAKRYGSCWEDKRCRKKRTQIEELLKTF